MELTLVVDHQCNLRCDYCYTGEKKRAPMSAAVMKRAIDLAVPAAGAHLDLSFFGGEPLLRLDLLRVAMEHARRRIDELAGPRPTLRGILNTNGTLWSEAALDFLQEQERAAVFVSLDGTREVHDRRRLDVLGRGTHSRVVEGLAALRERGIPFQLVAVVNVDGARYLGDSLAALLPLGADRITFSPNYRDPWTDAAIDDLRAGLSGLTAVWASELRAGRAPVVDPLDTKILTYLHGGAPCPSRCQIAGREWAVAPSGRIYPCAQMVGEDTNDELVVGTVESGLDRERARALQRTKDRVEETCAECALRDRCQSACGCRHVALTGELGRITATLCEIEAAFVDAADAVAAELFAERCPAFLTRYYQRAAALAPGARLTQLRRARDA